MTSMMPFVASQPSFTAFSSISSPSSSNFLGNPFWFPPNLSHSIFLPKLLIRHEFKSNDWIINTGATDHMVSILCLFGKWGRGLGHTYRHCANFFYFHSYWCFVSLLLASILFQLARLPRIFIVALFFLEIVVFSRTLLNGAQLVWVESALGCTCCRTHLCTLLLLSKLVLLQNCRTLD